MDEEGCQKCCHFKCQIFIFFIKTTQLSRQLDIVLLISNEEAQMSMKDLFQVCVCTLALSLSMVKISKISPALRLVYIGQCNCKNASQNANCSTYLGSLGSAITYRLLFICYCLNHSHITFVDFSLLQQDFLINEVNAQPYTSNLISTGNPPIQPAEKFGFQCHMCCAKKSTSF